MKNLTVLIIATVASVTPSLSQKKISSIHGNATMFVNTEHQPHEFSKLLLITGSVDEETNKKIQAQFQKIGIETITSLQVMPPVKVYSDEDVKAICQKHSVDGIVRVAVKGQEKSNARALAQTTYDLEVTLFDIQDDVIAVNFVGTSSSMKLDKAIHDYFRAIMEELKPILKKT